jgi:hypothetical protein
MGGGPSNAYRYDQQQKGGGMYVSSSKTKLAKYKPISSNFRETCL